MLLLRVVVTGSRDPHMHVCMKQQINRPQARTHVPTYLAHDGERGHVEGDARAGLELGLVQLGAAAHLAGEGGKGGELVVGCVGVFEWGWVKEWIGAARSTCRRVIPLEKTGGGEGGVMSEE